MFKRAAQLVVTALIATIGVFAVASPASASVGGCTSSTVISACVNYGDDGNRVRADFYQNRRPDSDQVYYRVAIHFVGTNYDDGAWVSPLTTIGGNGHYCCWYRTAQYSLPPGWHGIKTVVYTYTANHTVHSVFTSPIKQYWG